MEFDYPPGQRAVNANYGDVPSGLGKGDSSWSDRGRFWAEPAGARAPRHRLASVLSIAGSANERGRKSEAAAISEPAGGVGNYYCRPGLAIPLFRPDIHDVQRTKDGADDYRWRLLGDLYRSGDLDLCEES